MTSSTILSSKFKTVVVHTALNGATDTMIYELMEPVTFGEAQMLLNKGNSVYVLVTTEGIVCLSPQAISGFELHDPVLEDG